MSATSYRLYLCCVVSLITEVSAKHSSFFGICDALNLIFLHAVKLAYLLFWLLLIYRIKFKNHEAVHLTLHSAVSHKTRLKREVMDLLVNEIFHSIQGESTHSGRPCVFIRLSGCNLRCSYCDTQYAYEEGRKLKVENIEKQVAGYHCALVEITGGEPLLQKGTPLLIHRLLEKGYEVMLETNGSLDINPVDNRCIKIMDIKCPSSGESKKNDLDNLKRLHPKDQVKFVIGSREDFNYAREIMNLKEDHFPENHFLLSPVFGKCSPKELAEWILRDQINARLHLQLHKIIWPDVDRGR